MTTWRLQLRPRAPWATPLRADSLFGALCWRWLELFPESFDAMLAGFNSGEAPFVLSDAFPGDLLPLPLHVHRSSREDNSTGKKLKPPLYLEAMAFRRVVNGDEPATSEVSDRAYVPSAYLRTAIDRELGSAAEGQLYEIDAERLREGLETVSIYVRSARFLDELFACFRALALTGFGKKSSSGMGAFELPGEPQRCEWLDHADGANAFVSLSHFVPAANDPADGRWRLRVTYPKFHANAVANVFKGSILMLTPGSVFRSGGGPKPWYGSMLPMARPEMPKAVHYALAFAAPVRWDEEA